MCSMPRFGLPAMLKPVYCRRLNYIRVELFKRGLDEQFPINNIPGNVGGNAWVGWVCAWVGSSIE